jgi:hypothetical protein
MRLALKNDKQQVIRIIKDSFKDNNTINWFIKNDHKRDSRLTAFASYIFDIGFSRKGIFLSEDNEALAVFYRNKAKTNVFKDAVLNIKVISKAIGFNQIFNVIKRHIYLRKHKPSSDFFYFWLFAASDKGKGNGGAKELQKGLYELSENEKLPIYLETTILKNKNVYERYGFETYHIWKPGHQDLNMWFMRRNPAKTYKN